MDTAMRRIREAKEADAKYLDLSLCGLIKIPEEVFKLTNLTNLNLWGNYLEEIPNEIGQLTNLNVLDLRRNHIKVISKEISQLKNLGWLYLGENQIRDLPIEMGRLRNLQILDLKRNRLKEIPRIIVDLFKLEILKLEDNPLEVPPVEIASKGILQMRNYFKSLKQGITRLYEAKLIIVGQGGVGKTCLCKKLIDNNFQLGKKEVTTEGIEIQRWKLLCQKEGIGVDFKVNIWDFGGQEIYHATHQFFLTKRSLYLFVWDARKEEDYGSFDYWLNVVKLLSDGSPVIVVMNKADERIKEIDQASLRDKFDNIVGFHKVSCLNARGIKELTSQIKEEIINLPHVGVNWPNIWTDIRNKLENERRDYISYVEYLQVCSQNGLGEEKANYLSSFLHDLGVMLHFQDDYILRNIVILKPEWGTNAVYKVIDTPEVRDNKGRFTFRQLNEIWGRCGYPRDKYAELLQLMMKFELCFRLDGIDEYIVPELLSPERPHYSWNDKDNLRLEYHYNFMPSGIITRFTVRNHHIIESNKYWRNGLILYRDNTRALIISEPLNRKIRVLIYGAYKKELLAIIRNEFEYIHKTLNNPDVREMIACICEECKSNGEKDIEYYSLEQLKRYVEKGKINIECRRSLEDVPIEKLCEFIKFEETYCIEDQPVRNDIFISYSHKDAEWLDRLKTHLKPYMKVHNIKQWDDTMINSGEKWFEKINEAMRTAKVAILLVSSDFLNSDFITENEIPILLNLAREKRLRLVWIAVRDSSYQIYKLKDYQCANNPAKPLNKLLPADLDSELVKISRKIANALGIKL